MSRAKAKFASIFLIIAALLFVAAGTATWIMVTNQLKAEEITIPDDARWFAGEEVGGPLTAYSQADIINTHALAGTEGRTYAELGTLQREAIEEGDEELAAELTEQRNSIMNASFLRSSLFSSVIAYGVSALVIGLGAIMLLLGILLWPGKDRREEAYAGGRYDGDADVRDRRDGDLRDRDADRRDADLRDREAERRNDELHDRREADLRDDRRDADLRDGDRRDLRDVPADRRDGGAVPADRDLGREDLPRNER